MSEHAHQPALNAASVSRRRFVKTFALGTASSVLFGKVWRASVLADITPSGPGKLKIKVSDYPTLAANFGSVRIGLNPIDNPVEPLGPFYPILINHLSANTYYAMSTYCSHAGCVVPPYVESEGASTCACHGSTYAIDGSRLGGPARSGLDRYPLTFDGVDTLTIEVPDLGYRVETALVQNGTSPRLRLDFLAFYNVEYEVFFRPTVTAPWTAVPFALSLTGPANQTSFVGPTITFPSEVGAPASLFVDRTAPTGFYSIGIKLLDLTEL